MVKIEIIHSKFKSINETLEILRPYQKLSLQDFLRNKDSQFTVQYALLTAIQALLDVGNHILADRNIRNVADYRDIIVKLGQEKIMPPSFIESISDMAGFRNRLIHEYQDVDPQKVYGFLKERLGDFEEFMRLVRDHFRLS